MTGMDITSTLTCALAGHMNVVSSCSPWSRCSGYLWSNPERSSALGIDTHWGFEANGYVENVDTDWAGRRGRGFAASPDTVRAKLTQTRTGTGRNWGGGGGGGGRGGGGGARARRGAGARGRGAAGGAGAGRT